ncbi:MAG: hypothetical protein ACYSU0_18060 [Planctomycetota bacterium]|jgi:hypothetical protein
MGEELSRRRFLKRSASGSLAAGFCCAGLEERILLAALAQDAGTGGRGADSSKRGLPRGKIGKLEISRIIMGGNLIGGWAHSRDLIYVSRLFKAYNTEERILDTLALAEECGVNTIALHPKNLPVARKYNETRRGHMQIISELHIRLHTSPQQVEDMARKVIDGGACMIQIQGQCADDLVRKDKLDLIAKALEFVKKKGLPAGVGSHTLAVPMACEKHELGADYYLKTFHDHNYWTGSFPEHRSEWFEQGYRDNVWCTDPKETADFMQTVPKPWLAFKTLAAGAIHPRHGFRFAFEGGADFLCVGMFDFQVAQDVKMARTILQRIKKRPRPWRA